ncbi:zinc metalloprotease [Nocardiopsis sp. YSL2]|uniref:zinc metalloprotease n=1 Tax=Nocardiopsis sp. YSL2 TaxID=2939492 RepID=UPI0026F4511E|nr:zinc metalloprotease [Nocardiopsis sp. YSL2]
MCGAALTGLVASSLPDTAPTAAGPAASARQDAAEPCPPGLEARLSDPGLPGLLSEGGELTPGQAAEYEKRLREALEPLRAQDVAPPREVPVVVHVIEGEDGEGRVSGERVRDQIETLNAAYGGRFATGPQSTDTGFRFTLSGITRTVDDDWFSSFNDHRNVIRSHLRQGGPETLNLYTADLGPGLLGFSSFPQDYAAAPDQDGVVVAHDTLPGGGRGRFDLGHTATHEVGHWLGLFHTFQNGCEAPGDYVSDTPYEREAATGCPKGRDTCRTRRGLDPVHNFMNYSDDACMTSFTSGQAERMAEHWAAFRGGDPRALTRTGAAAE